MSKQKPSKKNLVIELEAKDPRDTMFRNLISRKQKAGIHPDRKKDNNKKACRGKVRDE